MMYGPELSLEDVVFNQAQLPFMGDQHILP